MANTVQREVLRGDFPARRDVGHSVAAGALPVTLQTWRSRLQTVAGAPDGAGLQLTPSYRIMYKLSFPCVTAIALLVSSGTAVAAEPAAEPAAAEPAGVEGGDVELSDSSVGPKVEAGADAKNSRENVKSDKKSIKRYRPTAHQMEFGVFGGVLLPNSEHELYAPTPPNGDNWVMYKKVAPDIGLRFGYYPLSFLGVEVEGGVMPTKLRDGGSSALLGGFRGYGILQLPYRVAPFVLVGDGVHGHASSRRSATTSTRRCTSAAA